MPSREDIANTLREAAERHLVTVGHQAFASKLIQRAAQVEAMLCETCKHYELPYTEPRTYDSIPDKCSKKQIRGQGKDFGCFLHEPKV